MGEKKNNGGGGEKKKDDTPVTVVLNIDKHCEGFYKKSNKAVIGFQGVESVKAESKANKLTLTRKVDTSKVQQSLAQKTKKKVELVSPKKDNKDNKEKKNDGKNNNRNDGDKKKKTADNNSKDKSVERRMVGRTKEEEVVVERRVVRMEAKNKTVVMVETLKSVTKKTKNLSVFE